MRDDESVMYQIRMQGRLGEDWSDWFEGMEMIVENNAAGRPVTTLTGPVVDQPALQGILARLAALNLPLISVKHIEGDTE